MYRFRSTLRLASLALVLAMLPRSTRAQDDARRSTPNRVRHFAITSTGPSGGPALCTAYQSVDRRMAEVLKQYGYPDESVFRFTELGACQGPGIDGRSTLANLRSAFTRLSKLLQSEDHLFIFLVGHGNPVGNGEFVHNLLGGNLTASELRGLLNRLPTKNITLALHPCFSGGFVPTVSCPGYVVVTSTNDHEENAVDWAGAFIDAFAARIQRQPNGPFDVSIKQAYNASLAPAQQRYGADLREHPLLDDNGDGVGHYGDAAIVSGDGSLASRRYLGNEGRRLIPSPAALQDLRGKIGKPIAVSRDRLTNVFAAESVFLGTIGGYQNNPGANLTDEEAHRAWAEEHEPWVVARDLVQKYLEQFDRQAEKGKPPAEHFYGLASAQMVSHGINLGNDGANLRDASEHQKWAATQTIPRLRAELEWKVQNLLAEAAEPLRRD